jgi:hypothetical protein
MNVRLAARALAALLVIAASGSLGHQECRAAMSLKDILGNNDDATVTSGTGTFTPGHPSPGARTSGASGRG